MSRRGVISIEPDKRGGRPCIRHMRIAVADVLGWLDAGRTYAQILDDFPALTEDDIKARWLSPLGTQWSSLWRTIIHHRHPEVFALQSRASLEGRRHRQQLGRSSFEARTAAQLALPNSRLRMTGIR
ncbi:DUF433 domain-containing protein [Bradyrhizobium sp. RDT46]|uniref:DUF433 domain-containing protein n=1 Tax=Bradyrhizobium sp. RDT46 TaxID=3341829 RepID=UPI0035C6A2EF